MREDRFYREPIFEGVNYEHIETIKEDENYKVLNTLLERSSAMVRDIVRFRKFPMSTDRFQMKIGCRYKGDMITVRIDITHEGDGIVLPVLENHVHYGSEEEHSLRVLIKEYDHYKPDEFIQKGIPSIFNILLQDWLRYSIYAIDSKYDSAGGGSYTMSVQSLLSAGYKKTKEKLDTQ